MIMTSGMVARRFNFLVEVLDLPEWKESNTDIVRMGDIWVVARQDPKDYLPLIREHVAAQKGAFLLQSFQLSPGV